MCFLRERCQKYLTRRRRWSWRWWFAFRLPHCIIFALGLISCRWRWHRRWCGSRRCCERKVLIEIGSFRPTRDIFFSRRFFITFRRRFLLTVVVVIWLLIWNFWRGFLCVLLLFIRVVLLLFFCAILNEQCFPFVKRHFLNRPARVEYSRKRIALTLWRRIAVTRLDRLPRLVLGKTCPPTNRSSLLLAVHLLSKPGMFPARSKAFNYSQDDQIYLHLLLLLFLCAVVVPLSIRSQIISDAVIVRVEFFFSHVVIVRFSSRRCLVEMCIDFDLRRQIHLRSVEKEKPAALCCVLRDCNSTRVADGARE